MSKINKIIKIKADEKYKLNLRSYLTKYYQSTYEFYEKKDWKKHLEVSGELILFCQKIPIYYLMEVQDELTEHIKKYTSQSILGFLIDYTFRLLRYRTDSSIEAFRELEKIYQKSDKKISGKSYVPIRIRGGKGYRIYTENAGLLTAALMISDYGILQTSYGFRSEDFLIVAQWLEGCRNFKEAAKDDLKIETAYNQSMCASLDKLLQDMGVDIGGEGGVLDILGAIGRGQDGGFGAVWDCFMANSDMNELVETLEDLVSCLEGKQPGRGSQVLSSTMMSNWRTDGEYHPLYGKRDRSVKGLAAIGPPKYIQEFEDGTTATTRVDAGGASTIFKDEDGNEIGSAFESPSGKYGWATFNDGSSYQWEKNDNGTMKSETITQKSSDGTMKTAQITYDKNGNATCSGAGCADLGMEDSSASNDSDADTDTSASTPVDEYIDSCLGLGVTDDFIQAKTEKTVTKLQTLVNPDPRDPGAWNEGIIECIDAFNSGRSTMNNCTSVSMCSEGCSVDENCNCDCGGGKGRNIEPGQSQCWNMMCADGTECDPARGGCRASSGEWEGTIPGRPIPSVSIDPPERGNPFIFPHGRQMTPRFKTASQLRNFILQRSHMSRKYFSHVQKEFRSTRRNGIFIGGFLGGLAGACAGLLLTAFLPLVPIGIGLGLASGFAYGQVNAKLKLSKRGLLDYEGVIR